MCIDLESSRSIITQSRTTHSQTNVSLTTVESVFIMFQTNPLRVVAIQLVQGCKQGSAFTRDHLTSAPEKLAPNLETSLNTSTSESGPIYDNG